ncbi:hypothetical protein [Nocardioides nanhaiensis]|uniref:YbaB/EbfC family DNA-binding protein n=1 Tax=Nocardioides nanhaiensis TaxID=1476871 RepID=A0ABP8W088_9ACTN
MTATDPTGAIGDVRDSLDRLVQQFEKAREQQQPAAGSDETGQVTVRVSAAGVVEDVVVGSSWLAELDGEQFGAAVLQAYAEAGARTLIPWAESLAEQEEPATRPMPTGPRPSLRDVVDKQTLARMGEPALREMARVLRTVRDDARQVDAEVSAMVARRIEGHSQQATVVLDGAGGLVGVQVDPAWAESTAPANLARHVLSAYDRARRSLGGRTVENVIADSNLGRMRRLAADPSALAAELGLR